MAYEVRSMGGKVGLYSLYNPEGEQRIIQKELILQKMKSTVRKQGDFLYGKRQSVFTVLYRLYNHC